MWFPPCSECGDILCGLDEPFCVGAHILRWANMDRAGVDWDVYKSLDSQWERDGYVQDCWRRREERPSENAEQGQAQVDVF